MGDLHSVSYLDDVGPYFILGHCFFFFDMLVLVGINFSRRPFPPQLMLWSREWPSRMPAASLGSEKHDGCQSHTTTCHYLYQRRGCFGKILTVSFLKSSSLPLLIFLIICENLALGSFTHPQCWEDSWTNSLSAVRCCPLLFASPVKEPMLQKHELWHNWHIFESPMVSRCSSWKCQGLIVLGSSSFGGTTAFQG